MLVMSACMPNRIIYQHADLLGAQHDLYVMRADGSETIKAEVCTFEGARRTKIAVSAGSTDQFSSK
jgi:hypothetical protein